MRLMIWVGDEGPTDLDLKDGDIWNVYPNTWTPGSEELSRWLIAEMEEYGGDQTELTRPEYTQGPSPEEPVIRHMRKYYVPYWTKLTPTQLQTVRSKTTQTPVVTGVFTLDDIVRK